MTGSAKTLSTVAEWSSRFWMGPFAAGTVPSDRMRPPIPGLRDVTVEVTADGGAFWSPGRTFHRRTSLDPAIDQARGEARPASTTYVLKLTPSAANSSSRVAGPPTGTSAAPTTSQTFDIQMRPLEIEYTLDEDFHIATVQARSDAGAPHGIAVLETTNTAATVTQTIHVDWRPDWLRRARHGGSTNVKPQTRRRFSGGSPVSPTVLVLHSTGNDEIGTAINTFTHPSNITGAHYIVDRDGHVVKMVHEDLACNHTGPAGWKSLIPLGNHAIGIEHVHATGSDFPEEQMAASERLVGELVGAHSIPAWNLVGHADIRLQGLNPVSDRTLHPSSRVACPGVTFPWSRFMNAGFALSPSATPPPSATYYRGYFDPPAGGTARPPLQRNDSDSARRYGGAVRSAAEFPTNDIIASLQDDLMRVGWWPQIPASGTFDGPTATMVNRLQARFLGTAGTSQVDADTAAMLQRVVRALDALGAP